MASSSCAIRAARRNISRVFTYPCPISGLSPAGSRQLRLAHYYAFKQSELAEEGIVSGGWASFLQAVVDAGLAVDGTWPVRTERGARSNSIGTNALASSIVLVCRRRAATAQTVTRADFLRALKREMPQAVEKIRKASVGPVDMPQSILKIRKQLLRDGGGHTSSAR
jgi:putative DNA methylase